MKAILAAAVALLLAIPAAASAATVPVTSLTGGFAATNPSVTLVADGVAFGPYADASQPPGVGSGGSVYYAGANGLTLSQFTALAYTVTHSSSNDSPISAPFLHIFLEGDHDVLFDPTECADVVPAENVATTFDVVAGTPSGTLRYDDDECTVDTDLTWTQIKADHGDEVVTGIYITTGFTGGTDLSALLSDLTVNDTTFAFGAPVAGPPGNTGATGPTGVAGTATTTVVVQQAASQVRLIGAQLRIIHVQRRKGEKFLSARAILRGKSLKVRGRAIQVDLRNKPAGNYNVHIVTKYRTKSGKVHIVRSTRNLSVTVA